MKRGMALIVSSVSMIAMAACSSASSSASSAAASVSQSVAASGSTVGATEKDFAIGLDTTSVSSGSVTFNITNAGPSTHEFVVFQTDAAPDALPVKDGEVQEDKLDNIGEQEDIESGATTALTLQLDAGSYVVICNLPGHYEQGMYAGLTVT
jgi:uncharacterized cupredoxin-like copper-binding protein